MGKEPNPAALVAHRAEWPARAAQLLSGIRAALKGMEGSEAASLEHIGSTSVSGHPAKPFLDLQLRISPLPSEDDLIERLEPLGYVRARGSRPDSPGADRDVPRLRLAVTDQVSALDTVLSAGRAPSGSLTVAAPRLSDDHEFPAGLYLRVIEGRSWLRGYRCDDEHVWSPDDRFAFRAADANVRS